MSFGLFSNVNFSDEGSIHTHQWGNAIIWTVGADLLIILGRYGAGIKHYHSIHGFSFLVMLIVVFFLKETRPNNFEKRMPDSQKSDYDILIALHATPGFFIWYFMIIIGIFGLFLRNSISTENSKFLSKLKTNKTSFRKGHLFFGVFLWVVVRWTCFTGAIMDYILNGLWIFCFLIVETIFFMLFIAYRESKHQGGYYKYLELNLDPEAERKLPFDKELTLLDNSMLPLNELPNELKSNNIYFKNYVVDLSNFIHPGGHWMLKHVWNKEVSRYIYGVGVLEAEPTTIWKHSSIALNVIKKNIVGTIFSQGNTDEWILRENGSHHAAYSRSQTWELAHKENIEGDSYYFDFKSSEFGIYAQPKGVEYFGKHYILSDENKGRIYSSCLSLSPEISAYRASLLDAFSSKTSNIRSELPTKISRLRFLVKCLSNKGALTRTLLDSELGEEFLIDGPFGNGLELKATTSGRIALFIAGTGIAPFVELLDFLLRKKIYSSLKASGASTSIVQPVQDYDNLLQTAQFEMYGAFKSVSEIVGVEWINKLAQLSAGTKSGLTHCVLRLTEGSLINYTSIIQTNSRFDKEFCSTNNIYECSKAYICGGPAFTTGTYNMLLAGGMDKDKLIIV